MKGYSRNTNKKERKKNKKTKKQTKERDKKVITENNRYFSAKMFHPATFWIN